MTEALLFADSAADHDPRSPGAKFAAVVSAIRGGATATITPTTRRIERIILDFRNPSLKMKKEGARLSIGILPESFS